MTTRIRLERRLTHEPRTIRHWLTVREMMARLSLSKSRVHEVVTERRMRVEVRTVRGRRYTVVAECCVEAEAGTEVCECGGAA
jgi:hypothetical protein